MFAYLIAFDTLNFRIRVLAFVIGNNIIVNIIVFEQTYLAASGITTSNGIETL